MPSVLKTRCIPIEAVRDAASAVYDAAIRTPLVRVELDADIAAATGMRELYLKLEVLQPIGSFKIRGAYNTVRQLSPAELERGVWTVSAGNAAQGVAYAARQLGVPCSVMVMDTAPDTKIRAIERLGATITRATYDECWRTVETHQSDRMTGCFVHPFDDDRFIAGNATAGLEILEDLPDVDAIVAPLGGGGLLSGIAAVVERAETGHAASMRRSLRRPRRWPRRSLPAGRCTSTAGRRRSSTAPAASRCSTPMWPLLSRAERLDRGHARRDRPRDALDGRARARHRGRRGRAAPSRRR